MSLKDIIANTIEELDSMDKYEDVDTKKVEHRAKELERKELLKEFKEEPTGKEALLDDLEESIDLRDNEELERILLEELKFLGSMKDRLLVLFEGLNSPNIKETEDKLNIITNFLDYQLSVVDYRIESIKKRVE